MRRASYLVAGCGQVGADLARRLDQEGHHVAVLDPDPEELKRLGLHFAGSQYRDSPLDREVLLKAGISRCDGLAAVFHDDATNLALALAARRLFRVPLVVARVDDPVLADLYQRLGVRTLCPQRWGVQRMMQLLLPSPFELVAHLDSHLDLVELAVPPSLVGKGPADLERPQELRVVVVSRAGQAHLVEDGMRFEPGDRLHVLVRGSAAARLESLWG